MINEVINKIKNEIGNDAVLLINSATTPEAAKEEISEYYLLHNTITFEQIKKIILESRDLDRFKKMNLKPLKKGVSKLLRQNSAKYHANVLERAGFCCEVCGWGNINLNLLHIHHIIPMSKYHKDFVALKEKPNKNFELANLIALCPNCHTFIHKLQNSINIQHLKRLHKIASSTYQYYQYEMLIKILSREIYYNRLTSENIFEEQQ